MRGTRSTTFDRRRFVQLMGWAGVVAMARGGPALAQAAAKTRAKANPPPSPPPAGGDQPPEISEDARALAAITRRRHGQHLNAEQIESIAKDFDGDLKAGKRLRDVKLSNSEEPDVTFKA